MTTYTTLAQCLARLGKNGDLTATTSPTLTEAASLHEGVHSDVNAALVEGGVSTVPVTTPTALVSWLGTVEAWGTCAEILKVRFQDIQGVNAEGAWSFFETRYQQALTSIRAGTAASLSGSPVMPASYYTRNPDEEEDLGDLVDLNVLTTTVDL